MTKTTTNKLSDSDNLVMLQLGYYGRFVLPVDAATEIMRLLIQSHAAAVDTHHPGNGVEAFYYPKKPELSLSALDHDFMSDCPVDSKLQEGYFSWLKTKAEIIGKGYVPETYSVYLTSKES